MPLSSGQRLDPVIRPGRGDNQLLVLCGPFQYWRCQQEIICPVEAVVESRVGRADLCEGFVDQRLEFPLERYSPFGVD